MFQESFLERKEMLLLSKQDTVACVQDSFQLLVISASWKCPRVTFGVVLVQMLRGTVEAKIKSQTMFEESSLKKCGGSMLRGMTAPLG